MNARSHWKCSAATWLVAAPPLAVLAHAAHLPVLDLAAYLALTPAAAAAGLGPDLDKPPERDHRSGEVHPGAAATEAHGFVGNWLGDLVSHACGGHRCRRHWWSTHRFSCAAAVGALLTAVALVAPALTLAIVTGWMGAWLLYVALPYRSRDWAWLVAAVASAGALALGWWPATPWTGVAVGIGWAMHIVCDRVQSGYSRLGHRIGLADWFALGGPFERALSLSSLAFGAWVAYGQLSPVVHL